MRCGAVRTRATALTPGRSHAQAAEIHVLPLPGKAGTSAVYASNRGHNSLRRGALALSLSLSGRFAVPGAVSCAHTRLACERQTPATLWPPPVRLRVSISEYATSGARGKPRLVVTKEGDTTSDEER